MYASDNAAGNYSKDERQELLNCEQERTNNPNYIFSSRCRGFERYLDKNADIAVLRIKRDVGTKHNLGFFATTYNFPERHNHTAGLDGRFRLTQKTVAEFQVVGTNSRRCFFNADLEPLASSAQVNRNKCSSSFNEYRTGNGLGYRVYLERSDRNLYMNYLAIGRSKDYRADVGFTNRVDTNYLGSFIQYQTDRDAKKAIIYKRINNATNVTYDWRGRSQGIQSNSQGMLALQRQFFVGAGFEYGYERVFEHEFGIKRSANRSGAFFGLSPERSAHRRELYGFLEATPFKQLFFSTVLSLSRGNLDYDFGAGPKFPRVSAPYLAWLEQCKGVENCTIPEPGYDPGGGKQLYLEASIRYQPTTAWQAQINYTRTKLTRFDTGRVAFDDNVISLRSTYQFSRDFFARMRLDYSNISTRLRPQLIFGWTPSPGTAFYAGYNDDFNYKGFNPYTGLPENGLRGNGRTFFIKASYLFRKSF
jgi:hypothetical protein